MPSSKTQEFEVVVRDGYECVALNPWEWMASVGVPERYFEASLSDYDDSAKSVQWLKSWSRESGQWLTALYGPIGSGKTHLAAAGLRRFVRQMPCQWVTWPELVVQVADSWKTGGESALVRRIVSTGCLVIDDLGAEGTAVGEEAASWQRRVAYEVINGRYNRLRPTIITTTLTVTELGQRFDPAITSRLSEGKWFKLIAGDRRKA